MSTGGEALSSYIALVIFSHLVW